MANNRSNHKKITLNDVAAEAGVSYMTVSRVVNNKGEISEETRQRVLQAIRNLGYRPNVLARSLAAGRSCTIGVVTVELYRFAPSRMATGIQQRCQELGYLVLVEWLGSPIEPLRHLDELAGRQVDAIIWLGSEHDFAMPWANPQLLAGLPPVVFCEVHPQPGLHAVTIENRGTAADLTRHLLAQGRRQIGLITGPLDRTVPRDRLAGWRDALTEAGLGPDESLVAPGDWSAASGERAFHELLERHPHLDAILASNDRMALGVLSVAHTLGRRVPEDIAVAGFDNIPEAAYFIPPLTTVQQPLFEVGRAAADLAIQLAEARRNGMPTPDESSLLLPSELIVRASTTGR
jgi:DNA-binding LacI/PurR family transcriptional regulator